MWHTYHAPSTLAEALALRSQYRDAGRIIAGGTDLILEMERGVRQPEALIDISRIPGLGCRMLMFRVNPYHRDLVCLPSHPWQG